MDAATLAQFEVGTPKRQTFRRGRRSIYMRFYRIDSDQLLTLPAAGDFFPGETSGPCVTADGVSIQPVEKSGGFVGFSIAITAQEPVYEDLSSGGTWPLGAYHVADDKVETFAGTTDHIQWRFEVPKASWSNLAVPDKGVETPDALGGLGAVLSKEVDHQSVPGFVVVTLITGTAWFLFDSLTQVECQTVTSRRKRVAALDGTPLAGPVEDHEGTQRYAVDGDDEEDLTLVQITITSVVSGIPDGWQGANFGKRNQAAITLRDVTYPTGTVLYIGGASGDIQASRSPTGSAAYKLVVVLLAAKEAWPLETTRYVETLNIQEVDVMKAGVPVGTSRVRSWERAGSGTTKTIRAEFDMAAAIAALP